MASGEYPGITSGRPVLEIPVTLFKRYVGVDYSDAALPLDWPAFLDDFPLP